jgi:exosome complex component RRP42
MSTLLTRVKLQQIKKAIEENQRLDQRNLNDYRPFKIEQGVIEKAEGSARILLGKTEVLVGIKVEKGTPYSDTPNNGVMTVNAELVPLASQKFEPGPPGEQAIELARIVDRGIRESEAIDTEKLCIIPGKKVFIVFIDIYVLNHDGNLIDASAMAAVSALMNTKMPNFEVADDEIVLKQGYTTLPLRDHPVTVTIGKIADKLIVDPGLDEEEVMDSRLSIAFTDAGNICAMQKGGSGYFTTNQLKEVMKLAISTAESQRKKLKW